jgi:hypothetical protein
MQYNYNVKPISLQPLMQGLRNRDERARLDKREHETEQLKMLAQKAIAGDQNALQQLAALNPQYATQIQQFQQPKFKEFDPKEYSQNLRAIKGFIDADDPQSAIAIVDQYAANLPPEARESVSRFKSAIISDMESNNGFATTKEKLGGYLASFQGEKETKVGMFKTQQVGDKLLLLNTATGETVKSWDSPKPLSSTMMKQLDTSVEKAYESDRTLTFMNELTDDLNSTDIGGGLTSSVSEYLKEKTGNQDIVSEIRMRARGLRNSQVVKNLPPGVASDKDIEMALKGFPPDNAPVEMWMSFIRGQSKLAAMDSAFYNFKADWISERKDPRGLYKAWKEQVSDNDYLSTLFGNQEYAGFEIIE